MDLKCIKSGSTGNCYILEAGESRLLLEAGINFKAIQKACNFELMQFDACLVTHEHCDHSKAVKDLLKKGLPVYATSGTFEALNLRYNHNMHKIEYGKTININDFKILPFQTQHDAKEPAGFLIEHSGNRLLFATDTYYIKYIFKKLNILAIECNYHLPILQKNMDLGYIPERYGKRVLKSHFSLDNVIKYLEKLDLTCCHKIYLLHLSDANSDADFFKSVIEKTFMIETEVF